MQEKELVSIEVDEIITGDKKLVLFNSSHYWDDVVRQLQKATGFDILQCEQIAILAHTKGKAIVTSGKTEKLNRISSLLREINLITKIE